MYVRKNHDYAPTSEYAPTPSNDDAPNVRAHEPDVELFYPSPYAHVPTYDEQYAHAHADAAPRDNAEIEPVFEREARV